MKLKDLATINYLMKARMALALQSEIPYPTAYAEAWRVLGEKFTALDCPANAGICFSNWKRYGGEEEVPLYSQEVTEPDYQEEWWNR